LKTRVSLEGKRGEKREKLEKKVFKDYCEKVRGNG